MAHLKGCKAARKLTTIPDLARCLCSPETFSFFECSDPCCVQNLGSGAECKMWVAILSSGDWLSQEEWTEPLQMPSPQVTRLLWVLCWWSFSFRKYPDRNGQAKMVWQWKKERLPTKTKLGHPRQQTLVCSDKGDNAIYKEASYYIQLGRIMVTYDVKQNSWHCPCARSRRSCLHKYIAKWHLFQTEDQLFRTVQSTDQTSPVHESVDDAGLLYPRPKELESMIRYVMNNKTIPAALPEHLCLPSFTRTYPTSLIPDEMFCHRCAGNVPLSDPLLITSKAKILTNTRIIHGK